MANDPREKHDESADQSFADILKEFETANRRVQQQRKTTPPPKGRGRGRPSGPPPKRGTVVGVAGDMVLIDYGEKSEGLIPAADLKDAEGNLTVKRGDTLDVSITGFNNEGMAKLS